MRDSKDLHCVRKLQTWTSMPYSERKLLNVLKNLLIIQIIKVHLVKFYMMQKLCIKKYQV